jgi:hypothetical protein
LRLHILGVGNDQVPVASEWAGLAKVGITLAMIFFGGGATIGLAIAAAALAGMAAAFLVGLFD